MTLSLEDNNVIRYLMRENKLVSEEGIIGLSLFEDEIETDFYTLELENI